MAEKEVEESREENLTKGEDGDRRRGRAGCPGHVDSGDLQANAKPVEEEGGRERLKRHRVAMAGRVWIPDTWGQEKLLKEWIDCAAIDRSLVPAGLMSAREALVEECRRSNPGVFPIESCCLST